MEQILSHIISYDLAILSKPDVLRLARTLQQPDGSYSDVDYKPVKIFFPAIVHLERLAELVLAYARPESELRADTSVRTQIQIGLDFWLKTKPRTDHGWFMEIGAPLQLERILLPFNSELTAEQRRQGAAMMLLAYFDGNFHYGHALATGQNKLWEARVALSSSCLTGNTEIMNHAARAVSEVIIISRAEGIQPDLSFHQHGPDLYNGGYGQGFGHDAPLVASFLAGTPLALSPEKIDLIVRYNLDAQPWMTCGRSWDFNTCGREVARPDHGTAPLAAAADVMAILRPDHAADARALADRLRGVTPALQNASIGHRHFWCSDYSSHMGAGWRMGLKMFSTRTTGTESGNHEGLKSYHLPEGSLCLMKTGLEYRRIYPAWNWRLIPGITAVQDQAAFKLIDWGTGARGNTSFVGGVSDGQMGASAFDFRRNGLLARKAWFFFDDQVVCLAAGITCEAADPVATSVEQCWRQGPLVKLDSGTRILHGDTGYWFAGGQKVTAEIEKRTGSWNSINQSEPVEAVESGEVFTCVLDHGVKPRDASYVYVVLPRTTEDRLRTYSPPTILANELSKQAVWNDAARAGAAAFYQPGTIEFPGAPSITTDSPCLLLLRLANEKLEISVSDPTQTQTQIALHITRQTNPEFLVDLPTGERAGATVKVITD